jgi:hypothetical protein
MLPSVTMEPKRSLAAVRMSRRRSSRSPNPGGSDAGASPLMPAPNTAVPSTDHPERYWGAAHGRGTSAGSPVCAGADRFRPRLAAVTIPDIYGGNGVNGRM